jgi:phosphate transport system substrate-binding protein
MTVAELNAMWAPDSTATLWSDIRDGWPDEEMVLYAPGVDSGTFDYFTEAINGDGGLSRTDFFPSEDDNVLVAGVEGDVHALGYFGYAYYLEEGDRLNAVHIDGGDGCIEPSTATIESGTYAPLARPLFIYVSVPAADDNTVVQDFVEFYLSEDAREFIADTGYALLDDAAYEIALERCHAREPGSLFIDGAGKTVLEVLRGE